MIAHYLQWIVLVVGVLLLAQACRGLAADARKGFEVSMGGAMLFSQIWLIGAAACAWGVASLFGLRWWAGLVVFVALFLLKSVAYRMIVALFLGRSLPAPAPNGGGFSAFIKRAESLDAQRSDGDGSKGPGS